MCLFYARTIDCRLIITPFAIVLKETENSVEIHILARGHFFVQPWVRFPIERTITCRAFRTCRRKCCGEPLSGDVEISRWSIESVSFKGLHGKP